MACPGPPELINEGLQDLRIVKPESHPYLDTLILKSEKVDFEIEIFIVGWPGTSGDHVGTPNLSRPLASTSAWLHA